MSMMDEAPQVPFSLVMASGGATVILASALAYMLMKSKSKQKALPQEKEVPVVEELDKQKYPGGHLSVFYGTQTGTAESFAQQLEREGADHGFLVHVVDLEDVTDVSELVERRDDDTNRSKAIFLMATYGEGEPTDNAAQFVNGLKMMTGLSVEEQEEKKESLDEVEQSCAALDYSVFGLGNRQYEHYNAMGRLVDKALEHVGGTRMVEMGLGDDDNDLEGDFESWKDSKLWPTLTRLYVSDTSLLENKKDHQQHVLPDCPFTVEYYDNKNVKPENIPLDQVHGSSRHYFTAVDCAVVGKRELRNASDPGSTVHVEIDISKTKEVTYQSADNLGVMPVNSATVVESVANSLGLDLSAVFRLHPAPGHEWHGAPFPMPISVRECLTKYCDLTGAPRRSDLKLLASYATDPMDKKALIRMASKEGRAEYREKIIDQHVGLVDIFNLCPSVQAPLEHFLTFCPRLHPRFYTIASSSSVHPTCIHLTVAVTQAARSDGSTFDGVCSTHLAGLNPNGDSVRVFCRDSTFRLPKNETRPILMIGPGTGVAPMRALLQERSHQRKTLKMSVGKNVLYFGCKKSSLDYIYRDEIEQFQKDGDLAELHVAFSREQKEKVYVQHLLSHNAKDTWDLIDSQQAYIYVCGGVKMGNDVADTLRDICCKQGGKSLADAKVYFTNLAQEGRFVQELWA